MSFSRRIIRALGRIAKSIVLVFFPYLDEQEADGEKGTSNLGHYRNYLGNSCYCNALS